MQGILSHFKWIKTYNKNKQVLGCSPADQLFSLPELKAQVSFSDHLSSVVCLSVCL